MRVAQALRPARGQGQDRIGIISNGDAVIVAVADGSGGVSGGAEAAERAIDHVAAFARDHGAASADSWAALIARIDAMNERGQCALVIAAIADGMIVGASAGDCSAWLITSEIKDLTDGQVRKPLVGSGSAVPVSFRHALDDGTLLLASDGLLKYARREDIARIALLDDLDEASRCLVKLPELRSGEIPDDIAAVLCRPA